MLESYSNIFHAMLEYREVVLLEYSNRIFQQFPLCQNILTMIPSERNEWTFNLTTCEEPPRGPAAGTLLLLCTLYFALLVEDALRGQHPLDDLRRAAAGPRRRNLTFTLYFVLCTACRWNILTFILSEKRRPFCWNHDGIFQHAWKMIESHAYIPTMIPTIIPTKRPDSNMSFSTLFS